MNQSRIYCDILVFDTINKKKNESCDKKEEYCCFCFHHSISINIDKCLGQSWRTNDRIETFRTRQRIENQFVCAEKDTTFELVTGISDYLIIEHESISILFVINE